MKTDKILVILFMLLISACSPEKDNGSIYDMPDKIVSKNDNSQSNDNEVNKSDNSNIPDDNNDLPDNNVGVDDQVADEEYPDEIVYLNCGNGKIDYEEVCEIESVIDCKDIDPALYLGGQAYCNEFCTGWDDSTCEKSGCESDVDDPDDAFEDSNCDGIDGDISGSIFVDKINGNNLNNGSKSKPVATITKALELAEKENKKHVLVGEGSYNEQIELKSGISIHGAYGGYPKWERKISYEVKILGSNPVIKGDSVSGLSLNYLTIKAGHNFTEGGSSYGAFLISSQEIFFNNVNIESGHGGDGADGEMGQNGENGENGIDGIKGCEDGGLGCNNCSRPLGGEGGFSSCGMTGGRGGDGGNGDVNGSPGSDGQGGTGTGGNGGTGPYTLTTCPDNSIKGNDGLIGSYGSHGTSGKALGGYDENGYIPSPGGNASDGEHGHGGGGGGGGCGGVDLCDSSGSSGGGGGAGGCGGKGGTGGGGGGGSFGIWLYKCSDIILRGVKIATSDGGKGGMGGNGGSGGVAGNGGSAGPYGGSSTQDDAGCGGDGGRGGDGGGGGHGGGGGGGPSIGIINIDSSVDGMLHTSFYTGNGGKGGQSGYNEGYAGISGQSSEF